jgi:membrane protein DedA with SNARE-associated domain
MPQGDPMQAWLSEVPAVVVYLAVFFLIGGQFVCLPLPGRVVLTTAGLLAVQGAVSPVVVSLVAAAGVLAGSAAGTGLGTAAAGPCSNGSWRASPECCRRSGSPGPRRCSNAGARGWSW